MKDQVIATIAKHLKEEGVRTDITSETEFEALDVDSLGLYSMLAGVEDEYDVMVPCGEFTGAKCIGDLADMFVGRIVPVAKAA